MLAGDGRLAAWSAEGRGLDIDQAIRPEPVGVTSNRPDPQSVLSQPQADGPGRGRVHLMTTHLQRTHFPSSDQLVVTDAGLETWLLHDKCIDLPEFAAYPLVASAHGRAKLTEYFDHFLAILDEAGTAVAPIARRGGRTDRATARHDLSELAALIAAWWMVADARDRWAGDQPDRRRRCRPRRRRLRALSATDPAAAAAYHSFQIDCMADTSVDVVTAMTIGSIEEAIGIVRAAARGICPSSCRSRSRPTAAAARDAARRRRNRATTAHRRLPDLLQDQLRPPDPLRRPRPDRRAVAGPLGGFRQRLDAEPRRAR